MGIFGENFLNPPAETLADCLQVMLYGLCGVFTVLILFFIITRIMVMIAGKMKP
jgi:hypothetical protein